MYVAMPPLSPKTRRTLCEERQRIIAYLQSESDSEEDQPVSHDLEYACSKDIPVDHTISFIQTCIRRFPLITWIVNQVVSPE
jgi:hypothetical protein